MSTVLFTATAIYARSRYVFNDPDNQIDLNAYKIDAFSPRNVWLLRYLVPGTNQVQYLLTFQPTSADLADANTIVGIYVEQDGKGVMIDCISIDNFNLAANGTNANLQRRYGAAPAFTTPTATWWCITRADDGSGFAHDRVVTDYIGQYYGNVRLKTNTSGVSTYTFLSYGTVIPIGTDSATTVC